mmetsp:Transcript_43271/g.71398  ORF Transcript_43271/g.71398 Transcript_43271/m.71398 type:complete len:82 (+) Transcript_43271:241-486(+)
MMSAAKMARAENPTKKAPRRPSCQRDCAALAIPSCGTAANLVRIASAGWLTKVDMKPARAPENIDTNDEFLFLLCNQGNCR